jgi:hypothetical protein
MTHDDGNSLIRYLYYSSWFDLEAMIITNQLPDFNHDDTGPWDKGMSILNAYQQELPQLRKHDPDLPGYEELMAVTKQGRGAFPLYGSPIPWSFPTGLPTAMLTSSWDSVIFTIGSEKEQPLMANPKILKEAISWYRFLKRTTTAPFCTGMGRYHHIRAGLVPFSPETWRREIQ